MEKRILSTAAVFGIVAIILGAFGAHALKDVLETQQLSTFETGVRYQMYNALFLFFVGSSNHISDKARRVIFYLVVIGVLFFSGSIYLLAIDSLISFDAKSIGFITPIGGLLLIVGWIWLFIDFNNKK